MPESEDELNTQKIANQIARETVEAGEQDAADQPAADHQEVYINEGGYTDQVEIEETDPVQPEEPVEAEETKEAVEVAEDG